MKKELAQLKTKQLKQNIFKDTINPYNCLLKNANFLIKIIND